MHGYDYQRLVHPMRLWSTRLRLVRRPVRTAMELCRLVYYSTSNISKKNVAADLKQILASAIRSNSECGLTGVLVFNRQYFAPLGATSRYRPPPSNRRSALALGRALRMRTSVIGMWGHHFLKTPRCPQKCPQIGPVSIHVPGRPWTPDFAISACILAT